MQERRHCGIGQFRIGCASVAVLLAVTPSDVSHGLPSVGWHRTGMAMGCIGRGVIPVSVRGEARQRTAAAIHQARALPMVGSARFRVARN
jgi:hypothetical protein